MYPTDRKYTQEHEWALVEGGRVRVGISHFAQKELGDVVFVDVPAVGKEVKAGENLAVVESVKAVSDIYAPVSGQVVEVNEALADHPELINEDPYGGGWIAVIEISDQQELDALMDADAYRELVGEE